MVKWWIIGGLVLLSIIWSWYRGDKILKARQRLLEDTTRIKSICDQDVYEVSYHGGIPNIPKAQKLYLALADEYFLFFNNKGDEQRVYYSNCFKVDKIITRHDPDLKGRSIVLWGPLIGLFLKVNFRYYIVIEYKDSTNKDNNILIECKDDMHQELLAKMKKHYKAAKRSLTASVQLA